MTQIPKAIHKNRPAYKKVLQLFYIAKILHKVEANDKWGKYTQLMSEQYS